MFARFMTLVIFGAGLAFSAQAGEPSLVNTLVPAKQVASFCGACTTSDDCGDGWVCCSHGCSGGKNKCYQAVSCDKLAETGSDGPVRASYLSAGGYQELRQAAERALSQ